MKLPTTSLRTQQRVQSSAWRCSTKLKIQHYLNKDMDCVRSVGRSYSSFFLTVLVFNVAGSLGSFAAGRSDAYKQHMVV